MSAQLKMQQDYFSTGLTLIGIVAGVIGTLFAGYFKAKREGYTQYTLAQLKQMKEFHDDVLEEVKSLRQENRALRARLQSLERKNTAHGWDNNGIV